MKHSSATASRILLSDQAQVFGFGLWNQKLEGQLTLTPEELMFASVSAKPVIIPTDTIQAVEAGYFRVGPLQSAPILRILHSDNVVWAVSVKDPEVWEENLRALAPNADPHQDIPRQSKGFRVLAGILLLIILVLSVAIPLISSITSARNNPTLQEAVD